MFYDTLHVFSHQVIKKKKTTTFQNMTLEKALETRYSS